MSPKPDLANDALYQLPGRLDKRLGRARRTAAADVRGRFTNSAQRVALPSPTARGLVASDGALESLKWLALILMTADHVNRYLPDGQVHALYAAGRLVFPLFAFVFAYNLGRSPMP